MGKQENICQQKSVSKQTGGGRNRYALAPLVPYQSMHILYCTSYASFCVNIKKMDNDFQQHICEVFYSFENKITSTPRDGNPAVISVGHTDITYIHAYIRTDDQSYLVKISQD